MPTSDKTIEVADYVLKQLRQQLYQQHAEAAAKGQVVVRAEQAIPTDAEPEVVEALRNAGSQWLTNIMGCVGFRVVQVEYGKEWKGEYEEGAIRDGFTTETVWPNEWGYAVTIEERLGGPVAKAVGFPDPEEKPD